MDRGLILDARGITFRYPHATRDAVHAVSWGIAAGEFVAVIGPNGSGKTSLLRVALGTYQPATGSALILDRPAVTWRRRDLARIVGVVTQREDNLFPQRVSETVRLGRYAHRGVWGVERATDREAVSRALAQCDVTDLADRWLWSLSGGEYQRVRIARALAQEPRLLVLDEPTAGLDLRHEMELFELVRRLVDRQGLGSVMVTHDVNLAARYADRVILLSEGRTAAQGPPRDVLTQQTVAEVYGWPVLISSFDGAPQVTPLRGEP